jgi:hypothetical protein
MMEMIKTLRILFLEKYHVVYTHVKRKRETQKMGLEIPEIQESP